jgi:hypothetical protein
MGKHAQSIDRKVARRISARKAGWVFTGSQFIDLGSPEAVRKALTRQVESGKIRHLARGLYDVPRLDPQLGLLSPSVEVIAEALKGRDAIRLQPSGAYAANLLGLSYQVPMRVVFLTDGPSRRVQVGKLQVILKRTTPRNMATEGRASGLVIQALRHLGKEHAADDVVQAIRRRLTEADRRLLVKDLRYAPAWVAEAMRRIAEPKEAWRWMPISVPGRRGGNSCVTRPRRSWAFLRSASRRTSGFAGPCASCSAYRNVVAT